MRRFVTTKSKYSTDPDLVLNLPLYETGLKANIFASYDIYANKCSVTGATWGPQGRTFNGTSDYIGIATSTLLQITDNLTIEAWIKPTSLPNPDHGIAGWFFAHNWNFYLDDTGYLGFQIQQVVGGSYALIANTTTPLNQWSHVVAIAKTPPTRPYMFIYQNTSLIGSGQASDAGIKSTDWASFVIGYFTSNTYDNFAGGIGEVRIYNRVLSLVEIQANYQSTRWRYGV